MNCRIVPPSSLAPSSPFLRVRSVAPLLACPAAAGFPSPAEEYVEGELDLHEHMVRNRAATFFVRAAGESMKEAGILDGDLLVVDRSLAPVSGSVVIASCDGELTVKFFRRRNGCAVLVPANGEYPELEVAGYEDVIVWGVVTYAIHSFVGTGRL